MGFSCFLGHKKEYITTITNRGKKTGIYQCTNRQCFKFFIGKPIEKKMHKEIKKKRTKG